MTQTPNVIGHYVPGIKEKNGTYSVTRREKPRLGIYLARTGKPFGKRSDLNLGNCETNGEVKVKQMYCKK